MFFWATAVQKQPAAQMPSRMHIDSWGPGFWTALHTAAYAYPAHPSAEQEDTARQFVRSVGGMLPCDVCRAHYRQRMKEHDMDEVVSGRKQLAAFVLDVHNAVNKLNDKKEWTAEEAYSYWVEDGRGDPVKENSCPALLMRPTKAGKARCQVAPTTAWFLVVATALALCAAAFGFTRLCAANRKAPRGRRIAVARQR